MPPITNKAGESAPPDEAEVARVAAGLRDLYRRWQDRNSQTADAYALRSEAVNALPGLLDTVDALSARVREVEAALEASVGYLMNAKIDLETGATKATAIRTIEGGIRRARSTLGKDTPR